MLKKAAILDSDFIIKNNKDRDNLDAVAKEVAEKVIDYYRDKF